jgi:Ca-activated chloride channel family protein
MKTTLATILAVVMVVTLSSCASAQPTAISIAAATEARLSNEEPYAVATEAPVSEVPQNLPAATNMPEAFPLIPTVAIAAPGNGADNYFQDYGVNPPTSTSRDNLSTFALDVDTASYEITSAYINGENALPPMDAVRAEEFINAFDQGYKIPDDSAFTVYADGGPSPFIESGNYLIRFGVQGYSVPASERKPANLTFVIDSSGSMEMDGRLEMVKDSLHLLVDQLDERDTVTIVAFSDDAWLVLEPTNASEKSTIDRAINSIYPISSTNADAGLQLGYRYAYRMLNPEFTNRIILCSDGVANQGNTSVDSMLEYVRSYADQGITMTGIGVGMGNFNDVLLEQLADNADGNYFYVNDQEQTRDIFLHKLTSTIQVIAYDAKIQIDFNPEVVETYRLIGYENRQIADEDFRDDSVDAGEVGAGMTATALYEIQLKNGAEGRIATAQLRWQDAETREIVEINGDFFTENLANTFEDTSPYFQLASTVAAYAEILRVSPYVEGDLSDVADEADRISLLLIEDAQVDEFAKLVNDTDWIARWQGMD